MSLPSTRKDRFFFLCGSSLSYTSLINPKTVKKNALKNTLTPHLKITKSSTFLYKRNLKDNKNNKKSRISSYWSLEAPSDGAVSE